MRKVLKRVVRRYLEVTSASLRALDRRDDGGSIDLRDTRRAADVIRLDPPARDDRRSREVR